MKIEIDMGTSQIVESAIRFKAQIWRSRKL